MDWHGAHVIVHGAPAVLTTGSPSSAQPSTTVSSSPLQGLGCIVHSAQSAQGCMLCAGSSACMRITVMRHYPSCPCCCTPARRNHMVHVAFLQLPRLFAAHQQRAARGTQLVVNGRSRCRGAATHIPCTHPVHQNRVLLKAGMQPHVLPIHRARCLHTTGSSLYAT